MPRIAVIVLAALLMTPLSAQQQPPTVFRSGAQLTVETVTVKDKAGHPVEGLTAKDFNITEDGVPQTISFVEFQRVQNVAEPAPPASPPPRVPAAAPASVPPRAAESQYQISPSTPGDIRYRDRRLLVLYFDLSAMPPADLMRAYTAGQKFITTQMKALQTAATMLRSLSEQKSLVYFASGLRLNGVDNQAQLRATTNAAIRANVAIFPVDARGLVAEAPLGDATRASPGGIGMFSGQLANAGLTSFQRSQDTLYSLAKDTGGKALFDNNDLSLGILQAAEAVSSYYIIGFYTTHPGRDGRFHRVKISLTGGLSADLTYRQGYFADKEFAKFTAADKERQLEEALMLENPVTEITIAMEVNYFQLNRAEYFVPVAVKMPGSELALARRRGAARTVIDFIGEVKDDYGVTIQNVRDKLDIKLSDDTASQLAKRPIQYETGFTLLPGKYVIKFLARDAETGRIGTYQSSFTIPNLNREEKRVPISSVVLSSQRVPLGGALYTVKKDAPPSADPLVYDGQKLIPSVTRVFSKGRDLYVFLQAYQRNELAMQPLVAFVSFYRGDVKVFETAPLAVTAGL